MKYSVFTKPWKNLTVEELCEKVSGWGFDGIEFPLREGYQVELVDDLTLPELQFVKGLFNAQKGCSEF